MQAQTPPTLAAPTVIVAPTVVVAAISPAAPAQATAVRTPAATILATRDATTTSGTTAGHYSVQAGDSLSALSRRFGVSTGDLATTNGIGPDAGLRTGQALNLPSGTWSDHYAIRVIQPSPGSRVRAPIDVRGTAATFEGLVIVEALDASGSRIAQVSAKASSPDAGLHGPFDIMLAVPMASADRAATVRVYWPSPRDGTPSDEIRIPVTIVGSG